VPDSFGSGPGPSNRNFNDTILTALSNANQGVATTTAVQDVRQPQPQQQTGPSAPPLPAPSLPAPSLPAPSLPPPPLPPPPSSPTAGGGQPPAGLPNGPPVPNLPQTATVTYAGGMLGAANGRFATGTYQNVWSFASRSGNFSATFDGARFQGMTFANSNGSTFNTRGPVASSNTSRQMELNGAFLGQGTQPEFQAGSFSVRGPRYIGGGVYLGEKR